MILRFSRRFAQWVTRYAALAVIPIAVLLFFPSPLMAIGFVAALGLFGCRWLAQGSPLPVLPVNFLILLLLAMATAGLAHSSAPDLAVLDAGQVVASVTIFYVLLDRLQVAGELWRVAALLVILGVLFAVAAPFTTGWSPDKVYGIPAFYDEIWPRLPKTTNPNILAGALAPIALIALALAAQAERRMRILGAAALAPIGIVLLLLQSRGALFALGAGVAVWLTLYRRWFLPLIPIGLIVALYLNQLYGGPSPAQFIYGKIGTVTGGTFIERQDMWFQAVYLIRQSPWVGIGLGAYSRIAPYTWPYSPSQPASLIAPHAHNLFLQVALDTGILGLTAFIVLLMTSLASAWRAFRRRVERDLAIGVMAALTVVIVHGFGDTIVWGTAKSSMVLWILLALAVGFDKVRKLG